MNLTTEEIGKLVYGGFYFIGLILPVITFGLLRRYFPNGRRGAHDKASVVVVWFLMIAYMFWTTPIRIDYRRSQESPDAELQGMWDGTGENSGTVVFGWILPVFSLLIFFGLSALIRSIRAAIKNHQADQA